MPQGLEANFRHWQFNYDRAKDGGAVGDITLRGPDIPDKAVILGGIVDVETAVTSGGATTIALKLESAEDILAATAKASFSLNALIACVPVFSAATAKRASGASGNKVVASIAAVAVDAGKFSVNLFGFVPR